MRNQSWFVSTVWSDINQIISRLFRLSKEQICQKLSEAKKHACNQHLDRSALQVNYLFTGFRGFVFRSILHVSWCHACLSLHFRLRPSDAFNRVIWSYPCNLRCPARKGSRSTGLSKTVHWNGARPVGQERTFDSSCLNSSELPKTGIITWWNKCWYCTATFSVLRNWSS